MGLWTRGDRTAVFVFLVCVGAFVSPVSSFVAIAQPGAAGGAGVDPSEAVGIDLVRVARSVAPGDDFFRHANGAWSRKTEIPPDRGSFGNSSIVQERTAQRTVELIQAAAAGKSAAGSAERKVGDFYASFMDEPAIE